MFRKVGAVCGDERGSEHSFVVSHDRLLFRRTFTIRDLTAATELRRALAESSPALGDVLPDAQVVLSELFANAALHGHVPITVEALALPGGVHLRVRDCGDGFGMPGADSRGLRLIAALAERWGVERERGRGTTVWADIIGSD
jgi:anti-sigma regulatory factor (Ser/Thr protein kinase)